MKKAYLVKLFLLSVLWASFFTGTVAYSDGGQLTNHGTITFYENASQEEIVSSSNGIKEKPKGKLPSTGERLRFKSTVAGIVLLFGLFLLFLSSKRKNPCKEEK